MVLDADTTSWLLGSSPLPRAENIRRLPWRAGPGRIFVTEFESRGTHSPKGPSTSALAVQFSYHVSPSDAGCWLRPRAFHVGGLLEGDETPGGTPRPNKAKAPRRVRAPIRVDAMRLAAVDCRSDGSGSSQDPPSERMYRDSPGGLPSDCSVR